jgi:uncharacterized membrane protein (DUF441 family)
MVMKMAPLFRVGLRARKGMPIGLILILGIGLMPISSGKTAAATQFRQGEILRNLSHKILLS